VLSNFNPRSLIGMTSGARKRRRNRMAWDYMFDLPEEESEGGFWKADAYRRDVLTPMMRIGERLKPCRFCAGPEHHCKGKQIAVDVVGDHRRGECVFCRTCTDAALTLRFENPDACDGSGVSITRIRCPGDHHFLIAERRWIPSSTCRLCMGRGVVKYPLARTGPKCPGCCNCAMGVCKKQDPDGCCGEEYMHCTEGVIPTQERT